MRSFTSRSVLVLSLSLILLLSFCCALHAGEKTPYKIGVNLELTGPWANVTKTLKMAMEMEVERVNAKGGINGHPLELIIEDNGFDMTRLSGNILIGKDPWILAQM